MDRRDLRDYKDRFKHLHPDVVLDMFPFSEADARSVISTFKAITRQVVAISSQDVYRAYGRLIGTETGPLEPVPLTEDAPLRRALYPHRGGDDMRNDYDKILIEHAVMSDPDLPGTVLRLPMVYGRGDTQHRLFPYLRRMDDRRPAIVLEEGYARWRWSRDYVENVAAAIALAVADERAGGRIYSVGEVEALSVAEWVTMIGKVAGWTGRVVATPKERVPEQMRVDMDTDQHVIADTSQICRELGYEEPVL